MSSSYQSRFVVLAENARTSEHRLHNIFLAQADISTCLVLGSALELHGSFRIIGSTCPFRCETDSSAHHHRR